VIPLPASYPKFSDIFNMAVSPASDAQRLSEAEKLAKTDSDKAEAIYKDILSKPPSTNETSIKNLETALVGLGELYRDARRADDLASLILQTRSALSSFTKAKTAKLGKDTLVSGLPLKNYS
jgi:26S proteasome regulatory subunit N6